MRGGADRATEAARADSLLTARFSRPFSEFFAIVMESPAPFADGAPRAALDSITSELGREPYIRALLSYRNANDSLFLSPDGRTTFFLVSVDAPAGTSGRIRRSSPTSSTATGSAVSRCPSHGWATATPCDRGRHN